jgi:NAD(P)-dependent dehydrogenase (short-subunit alcohol dehydrogenase family)
MVDQGAQMTDRAINPELARPRAAYPFDLSDQVAIVTGAAQGFGRAFCLFLAGAGADVAALDINGEGARKTADEVRALGRRSLGLAVDVTERTQIQRAVDEVVRQLGRLDILVNNAGINTGNDTPPADLSAEIWDRVMATNVSAYFFFSQAAIGPMAAAGRGRIINMASAAATRIPRLPTRHVVAYAVSKAAVVMLTRALALEWATLNVTVNSISPTYSDTGLIRREPSILEAMVASTPFHRLGLASDLEGILLYLASSASDFTTGQDFLIDGGFSL